jgi:hypothetical protein
LLPGVAWAAPVAGPVARPVWLLVAADVVQFGIAVAVHEVPWAPVAQAAFVQAVSAQPAFWTIAGGTQVSVQDVPGSAEAATGTDTAKATPAARSPARRIRRRLIVGSPS